MRFSSAIAEAESEGTGVAAERGGEPGKKGFSGETAVLPAAATAAFFATIATNYLSRELSVCSNQKSRPKTRDNVWRQKRPNGNVSFCACARNAC